MSEKTTIVVGGAGFVGLNIAERLLAQGEAVTILDAGPVPEAARAHLETLPGALTCTTCDVTDPAQIGPAMVAGASVVYGAAVTAGPERDRDAPERTLDVNLNGLLNVLRAARDSDCGRVINLSSAGAYGAAAFRHPLLHETEATDPVSLYSLTKFASERVGARMADIWGMDVISVRLSGVFGRWERKTSVRDTPSPQFQVMQAALEGHPALLERLDRRDWIYAPDVARAVIALRDAGTLHHDLYNVSTGQTWSVLDWGRALADEVPGFVCRLAEAGETATVDLHAAEDRGSLAVDRLATDTGFSACYGIERSVEDYLKWARSGSGTLT